MGIDSDESRVYSSGVPSVTRGGVLARVYFEVEVRNPTCSGGNCGH